MHSLLHDEAGNQKKSKWPWSVYIFIWTIHLSSFFRNGGWCGATGRVAVVVGPKPWLRMCKSLRRPKTIFVSRGPSSRRPKQLEVGFFFFFWPCQLGSLDRARQPHPIQPQATKNRRLGLAAWADGFRGSNPNRHSCIQQSTSSSRAM
jgi:hypothetical protein